MVPSASPRDSSAVAACTNIIAREQGWRSVRAAFVDQDVAKFRVATQETKRRSGIRIDTGTPRRTASVWTGLTGCDVCALMMRVRTGRARGFFLFFLPSLGV